MAETLKVSASGQSWTKKYSPEEKRSAALEAVQYLGLRRSLIACRHIRSGLHSESTLRTMFAFGGVQGFPVSALLDIFAPKVERNAS